MIEHGSGIGYWMILTYWIGKSLCLSFILNFILFMKDIKIGIISITFGLVTESIAQAWGRLKSLILKCPNHALSKEIIINNFYARLSCYDKDMLDASSMGSFTSKKVGAKWDLIKIIQCNTEDWEIDKGKESRINYEYNCS